MREHGLGSWRGERAWDWQIGGAAGVFEASEHSPGFRPGEQLVHGAVKGESIPEASLVGFARCEAGGDVFLLVQKGLCDGPVVAGAFFFRPPPVSCLAPGGLLLDSPCDCFVAGGRCFRPALRAQFLGGFQARDQALAELFDLLLTWRFVVDVVEAVELGAV